MRLLINKEFHILPASRDIKYVDRLFKKCCIHHSYVASHPETGEYTIKINQQKVTLTPAYIMKFLTLIEYGGNPNIWLKLYTPDGTQSTFELFVGSPNE